MGIVVFVFGIAPILSGGARIAVTVVGVLVMLVAIWRILTPRTGDASDPRDKPVEPGMHFGQGP